VLFVRVTEIAGEFVGNSKSEAWEGNYAGDPHILDRDINIAAFLVILTFAATRVFGEALFRGASTNVYATSSMPPE
jgi:hypothetical protein